VALLSQESKALFEQHTTLPDFLEEVGVDHQEIVEDLGLTRLTRMTLRDERFAEIFSEALEKNPELEKDLRRAQNSKLFKRLRKMWRGEVPEYAIPLLPLEEEVTGRKRRVDDRELPDDSSDEEEYSSDEEDYGARIRRRS